jgi:hypothetical protein
MASVFVRHRVRDYAAWKTVFDEHESARKEYGMTGHSLHRDASDPNMLMIAIRVNDIARAQEFAQSDTLREAMMRAGVEGMPEIWFTEDLEEKRY